MSETEYVQDIYGFWGPKEEPKPYKSMLPPPLDAFDEEEMARLLAGEIDVDQYQARFLGLLYMNILGVGEPLGN